jgi:hypothetical protein
MSVVALGEASLQLSLYSYATAMNGLADQEDLRLRFDVLTGKHRAHTADCTGRASAALPGCTGNTMPASPGCCDTRAASCS